MKLIARKYNNGFPDIGIEIIVKDGDDEIHIKNFNELSDDNAYINSMNFIKDSENNIEELLKNYKGINYENER